MNRKRLILSDANFPRNRQKQLAITSKNAAVEQRFRRKERRRTQQHTSDMLLEMKVIDWLGSDDDVRSTTSHAAFTDKHQSLDPKPATDDVPTTDVPKTELRLIPVRKRMKIGPGGFATWENHDDVEGFGGSGDDEDNDEFGFDDDDDDDGNNDDNDDDDDDDFLDSDISHAELFLMIIMTVILMKVLLYLVTSTTMMTLMTKTVIMMIVIWIISVFLSEIR